MRRGSRSAPWRGFVGAGSAIALMAGCASNGATASSAPDLLVGTGTLAFEPVGAAGVGVVFGAQGGHHIWIGLQAHHFDVRVTARYGVRDTVTGKDYTIADLQQAFDFQQEGAAEEISGLRAFLDEAQVPTLSGRKVTLWASVTDANDLTASSETPTFVAMAADPSGGTSSGATGGGGWVGAGCQGAGSGGQDAGTGGSGTGGSGAGGSGAH